MKNILLAAGISALLLFPLSACGDVSRQSEMSQEIQLDLSGGTQVSDYDTHSGNGDGISCAAFDFSEHPLTPELEASPGWTSFPLSTTAKALAYGISDENSSTGPYLTDGDGVPLVPVIQNGYYLLVDRQQDSQEPLLDRYSLNFTIALYDTDSDLLYVCRMDT